MKKKSVVTEKDVERFKELGFDVETIADIEQLQREQAEIADDLEPIIREQSEIAEDVERLRSERIGSDESKAVSFINSSALTPEQAADLTEWIITTDRGIYSEDAFDDRQKQAFLIIVRALVYNEDIHNREDILFAISRKVFSYSFARDCAEALFVNNGFKDYSSGNWDEREENSENQKSQASGGGVSSEIIQPPSLHVIDSWLGKQ